MGLFSNLFSAKDKKEEKVVQKSKPKKIKVKKHKKHSKSKANNKKPSHKKSVKKPIIKKPVFNSERDIEVYYKNEKDKLNNFLKDVEKEKANSYIDIANKQLAQVQNKKRGIDNLENNLKLHIGSINKKVKEISADSEKHKKNIDLVKKLEKSIVQLDKKAKDIVSIKQALIEKEKNLTKRMNELAAKSSEKLSFSDRENSRRFLDNERKKQELIEDSKNLVSEEAAKILMDSRLLNSIEQKAVTDIRDIHKELKNLNKEKLNTLKQLHLLDISEEEADKRLKESEKKVEDLKRKYKRILSHK